MAVRKYEYSSLQPAVPLYYFVVDTQAERPILVPPCYDGAMCWVKDVKTLYIWHAGAWMKLAPGA